MLSYSRQMTVQEAKQVGALTLAFIGDAVFEISTRDYAINVDKTGKPAALHKITSGVVNAASQAKIAEILLPELTEEEIYIYKRGRNTNPHTVPKNQSLLDYKKATGFEALIGFLYMTGNSERLDFVLKRSIEIFTGGFKTEEEKI